MTRTLRQRARRNGTRSTYAGDEPRADELTAHLPKSKRKVPKCTAKWRRKDKLNKRAAEAAYQARLTAPWPLYVRAKEGGST
jgi:hypothetical protein